jgi:oxygen-dependent protoporphyrinogen oxidase
MGVLFASSAFPHHAPEGSCLLRIFFGGSRTPDVNSKTPEALVQTSCETLRDALGVSGEPTLVDVCPYPDAIPQYGLDHIEKVSELRQHIAPLAGLHLAGNYLDGVSINDCVKLGKQVAAQVIDRVQAAT